jgi:hypothetical protein
MQVVLGLACDTSDHGLALRCVQADACYADGFERVRAELARGDEARYREIVRLYSGMVAAVKAGEFAQFAPPS